MHEGKASQEAHSPRFNTSPYFKHCFSLFVSPLFVSPLSFLFSHLFLKAALCSMSLADELCYLGVIKVQLRLLVSVLAPKLESLYKNRDL